MTTNGKELTQVEELSIQSRSKNDDFWGWSDALVMLARASDIVSPWWSRRRDIDLDVFWKQSDHISAALSMFATKFASITPKVEPRDTGIKAHVKQADIFNQALIEGSEFGEGWLTFSPKMVMDYSTQDNGMFAEVIGPGDPKGPIIGQPVGIAHLDSQLCRRTGNPEYPVIFQDVDGKLYRLHKTRVMLASSQPSGRATMKGVGFCALSRMINTAQHLVDIGIYKQEKLGSRPHRRLIVGNNISAQEILDAFQLAETSMDNQNLTRYSKSVVLARPKAQGNPIEIALHDLASAPDGFDEQQSTTLGMFLVALALNVPVRWIWAATQAGATKADAMFQHIAGMGGGVGYLLGQFITLLGGSDTGTRQKSGKFLPAHLKLTFDFQDDEQDRQQSEIREKRANTRKVDIETGVITIRVAREQALAAGDITNAQFEDLEIADGRLPDGSDLLALFNSNDPDILALLDLGVSDPTNILDNDPAEMLIEIDAAIQDVQEVIQAGIRIGNAKLALAALIKLQSAYQEAIASEVVVESTAEETNEPTTEST